MASYPSERLDPLAECWRIDALDAAGGARTAVFASYDMDGDGLGIPALVHFGEYLPLDEDLRVLARNHLIPVSGGMLDPLVPLTMCPMAMDGWTGRPGVELRNNSTGAPLYKRFYSKIAPQSGFASLADDKMIGLRWHVATDQAFDVNSSDVSGQFSAILHLKTGVLELSNSLKSTGDIRIVRLSAPVVSAPPEMAVVQDFGGRWCSEFQRQVAEFNTGQYVRENYEGRSGHAGFPGCALLQANTDEGHGNAMGLTFPSSAGHTMVCEQSPSGRRQVQFEEASSLTTMDEQHTIYIAASSEGLSGLSKSMTGHARQILPRRSREQQGAARPVHYNCWEAVYFRHDLDELKEIATKAADLGAERFVLDDGWFKGRNDDTTSLGDWVVDADKYPDGLGPLVDHVQSVGMRFGLWFEPEMVNRDSDLYRANPHWVLGPDEQPSGRQQYVLDLCIDGVVEYLFERIDAILREHPVDYIKWDHNRALFGGSPKQSHRLYELLRRINEAHPKVDIETCASGGGRIDYGILQYCSRVWLSDSNDAMVRMKMQHEASLWLPPEIQGSHVGPRVCHTSGRIYSISFRAWVAAQRHMGFEMDPRELTDDEVETLKHVTQWYKQNRDMLHAADLYRLDHDDPEVVAEISVSPGRDQFVLFKGQADPSKTVANLPLRFAGLDPQMIYELKIANPDDFLTVVNRRSASALLFGDTARLSGAALMAGKLHLPTQFPATMMVLEGRAVQNSVQGGQRP